MHNQRDTKKRRQAITGLSSDHDYHKRNLSCRIPETIDKLRRFILESFSITDSATKSKDQHYEKN